jgi:hypothetical protein
LGGAETAAVLPATDRHFAATWMVSLGFR